MKSMYSVLSWMMYFIPILIYYQVMTRLIILATPTVFSFVFVLYTLIWVFPPKHYAKEVKQFLKHWCAILGALYASIFILKQILGIE